MIRSKIFFVTFQNGCENVIVTVGYAAYEMLKIHYLRNAQLGTCFLAGETLNCDENFSFKTDKVNKFHEKFP